MPTDFFPYIKNTVIFAGNNQKPRQTYHPMSTTDKPHTPGQPDATTDTPRTPGQPGPETETETAPKRRKTLLVTGLLTAAVLALTGCVGQLWGIGGLITLGSVFGVTGIVGMLCTFSEEAPKSTLNTILKIYFILLTVGGIWSHYKLIRLQVQQQIDRQMEEDYQALADSATCLDYSSFLSGYPQSPYTDEIRERYYTLAQNDPAQLHTFARHPNAGTRQRTALRQNRQNGYTFTPYAFVSSTTGVLTVNNDSEYTLTLRYEGPVDQKVMLMPGETKTFPLPIGQYRATASVIDTDGKTGDYTTRDTITQNHFSYTYMTRRYSDSWSRRSHGPKGSRIHMLRYHNTVDENPFLSWPNNGD